MRALSCEIAQNALGAKMRQTPICVDPDLVTFNNGNPFEFGTVGTTFLFYITE